MTSVPQPQVIVDFYGICTHVEHDGKRKVVLVNASRPHHRFEHVPKLKGLAAHHALFQVERKDLVSTTLPDAPSFQILAETKDYVAWKMDGVTITVPSAVSTVTGAQPATCIPHLSALCPTLPSLGPAAHERNAQWTSCSFESVPTLLEGRRTAGGAAVGRVVLTTNQFPIVSIAPFDGNTPFQLEVQPGARLVIANIPIDPSSDKTEDFYFHYVVTMKGVTAGDFPQNAGTPHAAMQCPPIGTYLGPLGIPDITTPGCSNSDYP